MPRTSTSSSMAFPSAPAPAQEPPRTPVRSRFGVPAMPTPFSGKRKGTSDAAPSPVTPIKSAFPSSVPIKKAMSTGEESYPTPSKEKDLKKVKDSIFRSSSTGKENNQARESSSVAARARARIASVLSKPSITTAAAAAQAQQDREDLHLSSAANDLVDTLRAIRARSASTASVDSVSTIRASLSLDRPTMASQSKKRERTDSMVSVRTTRTLDDAAPSRKRERVDSSASVQSAYQVEAGSGKRQRLHSSSAGGASAAALAARTAVAASRAQQAAQQRQKTPTNDDENDEEEVRQMLGSSEAPATPKSDSSKKASAIDLLRSRSKAPLLRKESTCALITPALASARLSAAAEDNLHRIPSDPRTPTTSGPRSLSAELDSSFLIMDEKHVPSRPVVKNPAGEGYALDIDLADAAFWDISPSSKIPLVIHGKLILHDPAPSYSYPPDVALDIACTIAPVQRGLGRMTRPIEHERPVDVIVDREWDRVKVGWTAPFELRVPPNLFLCAESRMLTLSLEGNLLLPRGRGDVEIAAQSSISVSALSTPREMALSDAEKVRMEAIAAEREKHEALYRSAMDMERARLMNLSYEEMTDEERQAFREWIDAQEDVL